MYLNLLYTHIPAYSYFLCTVCSKSHVAKISCWVQI